MSEKCQCVVFSNEAYNAVMTETFKKHPLETGGILLGHVLENGYWIVIEVLPPGWRSTFRYAYFEYDEEFVNYVAQNESRKYRRPLSVLGLWHRHPGSFDRFSGTDDQTNATFARLSPMGALSGLVNVDPRFRLTMFHVDAPLAYEHVAVEVGDDIIPEEYFELNYYDDGKDLNPFPVGDDGVRKAVEHISNAPAKDEAPAPVGGKPQAKPRRNGLCAMLTVAVIASLLSLGLWSGAVWLCGESGGVRDKKDKTVETVAKPAKAADAAKKDVKSSCDVDVQWRTVAGIAAAIIQIAGVVCAVIAIRKTQKAK